jgi:hypothetical protein
LFFDITAEEPDLLNEAYDNARQELIEEYLSQPELLPDEPSSDAVPDLLSYQDANIPDDFKEKSLFAVLHSDSGDKYTEDLSRTFDEIGAVETVLVAEAIKVEAVKLCKNLGIPVSPYANSITWVLWDIAKQRYLKNNPSESGVGYELGDPLQKTEESFAKRNEIMHRHIGWEAYQAYKSDPEFKKKMDDKYEWGAKREVYDLFNRQPKENGTLSSKELAALGRCLVP